MNKAAGSNHSDRPISHPNDQSVSHLNRRPDDPVEHLNRRPDDPMSSRKDDGPVYLGIDLGGTTAKLGLFRDLRGSSGKSGPAGDPAEAALPQPDLIARMAIPTRTEDHGSQIMADIADAIQRLAEDAGISPSDIEGAGIGVPGPVLDENEWGFPVAGCVNLNWHGTRYIDQELADLTGIRRIYVCNDANAAALGELYFGRDPHEDASGGSMAAAASSAVMVTLGTGIGGGVIRKGRVITGAFGAAGEIGHMPMRPAHPFLQDLCRQCPGLQPSSDLEYYASATGISRIATAALLASDQASDLRAFAPDLALLADPSHEDRGDGSFPGPFRGVPAETAGSTSPASSSPLLEARHVFDAAKNGDALAIAVTDFFFDILGQGLAAIASVVDPELFIIGGGVAAAGDFLLQGLEGSYRRQVFHASRGTAFRLATLGNDAGLLGPLVPLLR